MAEDKQKETVQEKKKEEVENKPAQPSPNHPPSEEKVEEKREVEEKAEEQVIVEKPFDPHKIILYPLSTEKSIRQIEFDNKLVFAVHPRATKKDIKKAVEELFKVKVTRVNVQNSFQGEKKAYVRLGPEHLASDVSADLGLI